MSSARRLALAAVVAIVALAAGACSSSRTSTPAGPSGKVALLLPDLDTSRYEAADVPYFSQKLLDVCPACTVDYKNADNSADTQRSQAQAELDAGATVLVISAVDGKAAAAIVTAAKAKNVPVIAYDRLILGAAVDYYISFDNAKVGTLQAQALLTALGPKAGTGKILWVNGSPTDNNAKLFKSGAHAVLDGKVSVAAEFDTPGWKPDNAQAWATRELAALQGQPIVGVYAANDGTAGGVIAALHAAGRADVPVTGQDAQVDALQRILSGSQYMTVYKAIRPEAERAATLAVDLMRGRKDQAPSTIDNGAGQVPSFLLDPVAVTKADIKGTVLKDGFVTVASLCTGASSESCHTAGIS
jgi:D-xylose transport system substrate-binding protein